METVPHIYAPMPGATPLPELYRDMVGASIDARGVTPHQAIALNRHQKLVCASIIGDERNVAQWLRSVLASDPAELIYATDRYAKDGQGTELADLVAGAYLTLGRWRPFIIEYRHEPRIVKPVCWDNPHWNEMIERELSWMLPGSSSTGSASLRGQWAAEPERAS